MNRSLARHQVHAWNHGTAAVSCSRRHTIARGVRVVNKGAPSKRLLGKTRHCRRALNAADVSLKDTLEGVEEFARANIRLSLLDLSAIAYAMTGFRFVPSLSIPDVLIWSQSATLSEMLGPSSSIPPA